MGEIKCYFDISIGGQDSGRIIFELFNQKCPKTCKNFKALCTGELGKNRYGVSLHYKGSSFHRIVRNFMIQGGDITDGNGKGGDSIYDGSFGDENLSLKHDQPYLLSMANRGPNTNKSQFFITTNEAPHLDGKHVVFGRVVSGRDTIVKIESQEVDSKSRPLKEVIIRSCGQLSHTDIESPRRDTLERKKRKQSASSRSSDDLHTVRRNRRRHTTSSSRSPSCSSSASSRATRSRSSHSKPFRHKRSPSCSSSSSGSSSTGSSSGTSSSSSSSSSTSDDSRSVSSRSSGDSRSSRSHGRIVKSNIASSSGSISSSSSEGRPKKRCKTNRRLVPTRDVEDFKPAIEKVIDKTESETFTNPHYKCSVKLDEIPDVPVNRFLLRGAPDHERQPIRDNERDRYRRDETPPLMEVDLSKFEDISDGSDHDNGDKPASMLRSQIKATESLVSKSGRVMKGRGTFKFRTPSPDDNSSNRGGSYRNRPRSPSRYSSSRYHHSSRRMPR